MSNEIHRETSGAFSGPLTDKRILRDLMRHSMVEYKGKVKGEGVKNKSTENNVSVI